MSDQNKDEIGAAELEVGRAVYARVASLIGAESGTPDGRELAYLTYLTESVEEVGGYDGPRQDDPFSAEAILARLARDVENRGVDTSHFNDPAIAAVFLIDRLRPQSAGQPAGGDAQ